MSTSGGPIEQTVNNPEDFGFLGWTNDPIVASSSATLSLGVVTLVRFRCAKGGACGHLAYTVTVAGAVLTAGQNLVGIYDTGQASAGNATLLSTSADQSVNMATAGTYGGVLSTPPALITGYDYFAAILTNGTTAPTLIRSVSGTGIALWNYNLVGLSLRTATNGAAITAFPASIAAGSIAGGGAPFTLLAAP